MAPPADPDPGTTAGATPAARVRVAVVTSAHGIAGWVRIRPFTEDPLAFAGYAPLTDRSGRIQYRLRIHGVHKGQVLAQLSGVQDRTTAEALKGTELWAPRDCLPPPEDEDEVLIEDLIGLEVRNSGGVAIGRITAVYNYGAGDVVEVALTEGGARPLWPFTRAVFPALAVAAGHVVADPPVFTGEPEPADLEASGGRDPEPLADGGGDDPGDVGPEPSPGDGGPRG